MKCRWNTVQFQFREQGMCDEMVLEKSKEQLRKDIQSSLAFSVIVCGLKTMLALIKLN